MRSKEDKLKLLEAVKELVDLGHGRVYIARKLGISDGMATRLIRKIKGEDLTQDTGVISQVTNLLQRGVPENSINNKLEGVLDDEELRCILNSIEVPGRSVEELTSTPWVDMDSKQKFSTVSSLMELGLGSTKIGQALGLAESTVRYHMDKVRLNLTRATSVDKVREMLDTNSDAYDIAKALNRSVPATISLIKKAECQFSPVDEWVKKASKNGVLFSRMQEQLKIKSLDKAKEVILANFPGCFVVELREENDTRLVPVYDSRKEVEYLHIDTNKKPFNYYVSPAKNYMLIKVDDNYGENELVLPYLSDLHIGSEHHRPEILASLIKWIGSTPGMIPLLGGDLIENISKQSAGRIDEQYSNPNEQVTEACKRLESIAHLIPFSVSGNHEDRVERFSGFDLGAVIADLLKTPYFRSYVVMDIMWRDVRKTIYATHKFGRGSYSIAQVEASVLKLRQTTNYHCSAYYGGHSHVSFVLPKESIELVPGRGFQHERWYILNNGSTTRRTGGYGESFPPGPQDMVYTTLDESGTIHAHSIPITGE